MIAYFCKSQWPDKFKTNSYLSGWIASHAGMSCTAIQSLRSFEESNELALWPVVVKIP